MTRRPPRPHRLSARLSGVVAAWLVIAGQLGGPLHHLAVEHTVCAAHGEIVHADDHHAEAAHDHAPAPATFTAALLPVAPDQHGEHDHCDALWRHDERDATPPRSLALAAPPATGPPDALASLRAAPAPRALYRTAPKADPPARAA